MCYNVSQSIKKCPSTEIALSLLKRFEKLQLGCLYLDDRYYDLIKMYTQEIEMIRDRYVYQIQILSDNEGSTTNR